MSLCFPRGPDDISVLECAEGTAADIAIVTAVIDEVGKRVVGQRYMVERLLIGLLTGGHLLLEGVPGLAKTLTVRTLAETISTTFQRIQFTPNLLPADVSGTQIYDQRTGDFSVKHGPIFANIVLADEINCAPVGAACAAVRALRPGGGTARSGRVVHRDPAGRGPQPGNGAALAAGRGVTGATTEPTASGPAHAERGASRPPLGERLP